MLRLSFRYVIRGIQKTLRYRNWFTDYGECEECGYRTREVRRKVVTEPTYTETGRGIETQRCDYCGHHGRSYYTIPVREKSESSGGLSSTGVGFSGGGPSGGGASGSW